METVILNADSGKEYEVGIVQEEYQMGYASHKVLTVPIYDERYKYVLADDMMNRPRNGFDTIIMCTGERRTGKTTLCAQLARVIDEAFPVKHMTFRLEDFNQALKDNPYADPKKGIYPQVVLDEAGFDLFSQNWMERMQRNMVKKFEVIGIKKQIIYLVLPHRDMLNKKLREGMAQFWLNTETRQGKRGLVELRRGMPNKWQLDRYWAPYAAFIFDDMDTDPWWDEYVVKKRTFVDEVADETESVGPEKKNWRKEWIVWLYKTTDRSYRDVAETTGTSLSVTASYLKGVTKG